MRPAVVRSDYDKLVDHARALEMWPELHTRGGKVTMLRVANSRGDALTENVKRSLNKAARSLLERMPA